MVENDNNSTERDNRLRLLISKGAELAEGPLVLPLGQ